MGCGCSFGGVCLQKKAAEKKDSETSKAVAIQVDDLLTFRQFSKKAVEDIVDVRALSSLLGKVWLMSMLCSGP